MGRKSVYDVGIKIQYVYRLTGKQEPQAECICLSVAGKSGYVGWQLKHPQGSDLFKS